MSNKPFFSIVLPTLNRANFLQFAIKSVLNQTYEDFELIVSNNASVDETEEVIKCFDDPRIKYVRTNKTLQIAQHWQFALSYVTGHYVTFLGDDDALNFEFLSSSENMLSKSQKEVVSCKMAQYHHHHVNSYGLSVPAGTLSFDEYSGKFNDISSSQAIRYIMANYGKLTETNLNSIAFPQLVGSVYKNRILERINNKFGCLLSSVVGDIESAIKTLLLIDSYVFIDKPLYIHGVSQINFSANPEISQEMVATETENLDLPLTYVTSKNLAIYKIIEVLKFAEEESLLSEIDWAGYFISCYEEIICLQLKNYDVSKLKNSFFSALSKQPKSVIEKVKSSAPFSIKSKSRQLFRTTIGNSSIVRKLRESVFNVLYKDKVNWKGVYENIFESSKINI